MLWSDLAFLPLLFSRRMHRLLVWCERLGCFAPFVGEIRGPGSHLLALLFRFHIIFQWYQVLIRCGMLFKTEYTVVVVLYETDCRLNFKLLLLLLFLFCTLHVHDVKNDDFIIFVRRLL